jgi:hypothetical protein
MSDSDAVRPSGDETVDVELPLGRAGFDELRRRAESIAPGDEEMFSRYLVYLGAGYLEAEAASASAADVEEACARVHRLLGAVDGQTSVLHFHYAESAREYAEEQRAHAAHERTAGAHEALIEKLEEEIAAREQRIANLEAALRR